MHIQALICVQAIWKSDICLWSDPSGLIHFKMCTNGRGALFQETLEIERSQMTEEEEAEREQLCSASKTRLRIMEKHLQRLEEQVSPRPGTLPISCVRVVVQRGPGPVTVCCMPRYGPMPNQRRLCEGIKHWTQGCGRTPGWSTPHEQWAYDSPSHLAGG